MPRLFRSDSTRPDRHAVRVTGLEPACSPFFIPTCGWAACRTHFRAEVRPLPTNRDAAAVRFVTAEPTATDGPRFERSGKMKKGRPRQPLKAGPLCRRGTASVSNFRSDVSVNKIAEAFSLDAVDIASRN